MRISFRVKSRARGTVAWHHLAAMITPALAPRSGSDLFALANAIAGMVGGATVIEGRQSVTHSHLPPPYWAASLPPSTAAGT
ncbi:hypothetical protein GCM10029964_099560 [Kibdelosporangium lantanae]